MRRLFLIAAVAACGDAPAGTYTIDTLPNGAVHVVNTAPAMWADTNGWKIVLETEHTFALDAPGYLEAPNYPHTFRDGSMAVVNQLPAYVQRYSPTFEPLQRIGQQGSGPGEFEDAALRVLGDSVVVFDSRRSVLVLFDRDGTYLRQDLVPTMTDWLGIPDHEGSIPLVGRYRAGSDVGVMWWSVAEGRATDSLFGPAGPAMRRWESCMLTIPNQPDLDLAPAPARRAWYGISDADRFVLTTTGTDTVRIAETIGRPRFPGDSARLDELFDPDGFFVERCGPEMRRGDVPREQPAWRGLTMDAQGNLWVRRPAEFGASYDVYDVEGIWLGEVPSPFGRDENVYWQGDVAMSVTRPDESGYTLRRYRVER
jgi:hypothetical protein